MSLFSRPSLKKTGDGGRSLLCGAVDFLCTDDGESTRVARGVAEGGVEEMRGAGGLGSSETGGGGAGTARSVGRPVIGLIPMESPRAFRCLIAPGGSLLAAGRSGQPAIVSRCLRSSVEILRMVAQYEIVCSWRFEATPILACTFFRWPNGTASRGSRMWSRPRSQSTSNTSWTSISASLASARTVVDFRVTRILRSARSRP